jgi:hypothetical protein
MVAESKTIYGETQELNVNLTEVKPNFQPIFTEPWNFLCVMAPRGSGKTVLALQLCLQKYLLNPNKPNCEIGFYGTTNENVKKIIEPKIECYKNLLESSGNKDMLKYNQTTGECKVFYGRGDIRRMYVGSYEMRERIRSTHLEFLVLDETSLLPPTLFYSVIKPILSHMGTKGKMLCIGTPKPATGDLFIELFENGLPEKKRECWDWLNKYVANEADESEFNLDRLRWKSYWFKASETDLLDPIFLAAEKASMPREIYDMEYECNYKSRVGKGYSFANKLAKYEDHIRNDITFDRTRPVFASWDLGHSCSTVAWLYQINGSERFFIDYYEGNEEHISTHLNAIEKMGHPITTHFLPHDSTSKHVDSKETTYQTFLNYGYHVRRLSRTQTKGLDILNTIEMIGSSYFHKTKCEKGLEHLRRYELKSDKYSENTYPQPTEQCKAHWDCVDALRYAWQAGTEYGRKANEFEVQYMKGTQYNDRR